MQEVKTPGSGNISKTCIVKSWLYVAYCFDSEESCWSGWNALCGALEAGSP